MKKDFRFKIISDGLKDGVSATCRKYNISRTLYYRWLKRYQANGIDGLKDMQKDFVPVNKTDIHIESALLNLIKDYPHYGPKALKHLFDELGYEISESAIYNIMKRNNLNRQAYRIEFAKQQPTNLTESIPPLEELKSGECWVFWITDYGYFDSIGNIYEYTLFDLKSKIASTRLYTEVSLAHFENLLTALAMPIAQTLHLDVKFLCFLQEDRLVSRLGKTFKSKINSLISDNGLDFKIHILSADSQDISQINSLKEKYTQGCLSFGMPYIHENITFSQLKSKFQGYIKYYNLMAKSTYDQGDYSPTQYHNMMTDTKLILPIWAYMDRPY